MYFVSLLITLGIQVGGFAIAYPLQTEKFYDILGGVNYIVLAAYSFLASRQDNESWETRKLAMTLVFVVSRLWLLLFLTWRAHERKGDARFDKIKPNFAYFLVVWLVQGMWVFFISTPLLYVNASTSKTEEPLSLFEIISLGGFASGVLIEIAGDIQKARWVKEGRVGGFCTRGLWNFSRHPNYFGEIFQWWCAFLFAFGCSEDGLADPLWWCCSVSPLFTMQVLLFMSGTGVSNAEGKNLKRYYDKCPEDYAAYRESTSVLIPMVGSQKVPLFLKRTIFLDFERYEYKPRSESKTE